MLHMRLFFVLFFFHCNCACEYKILHLLKNDLHVIERWETLCSTGSKRSGNPIYCTSDEICGNIGFDRHPNESAKKSFID